MGYYCYFIAFLLSWNLLFCDATVTVSLINSANGVDSLECGSDGIVNCRINPHTDFINWFIDDTHYATCSPGCTKNPSFPRTYPSTYDATDGVFSLTIDIATLNDSNTSFKCDDGSSYGTLTIKVVPAYSENTTSIKKTDEGKQVEFTTTCVQPGVEFNWFTVKADNSERKTYYQRQHKTTNATVCSVGSKCSRNGTSKVSSMITIPTVLHGEERYLEVDVTYNNPNDKRRFRFDEPFQFKGPISSTPITSVSVSVPQSKTLHSTPSVEKTTLVIFKKGSKDGLVIVVSVIGSCFISVLAVVAFFIFYKKRKSKARSHSTEL